MAKAGRGSEQVMVRLPDGMRDRIRQRAQAANRSMNAEIVSQIEFALQMAELNDEWKESQPKSEARQETFPDAVERTVTEARLTMIEHHLAEILRRLDK